MLVACDDAPAVPASTTTTATTAEPDTTVVEDTTTAPVEDTTVTEPDVVLPAITSTHSMFIGDWDMAAGRETTKCVVKRLDNEDELWVSRIRTELAPGSHHMIVYKSADTEEQLTPFNCDPFIETLGGETYPLMITQVREEALQFPKGVAFKFEPHQMVRIESHFLNYFPDAIVAHGDVHFDGIAAEDVEYQANLLFYGNVDIKIDPGQKYSTPWSFLSVPPDTKVFAITGHTHTYGTNVEIKTASDVDNPITSLYPAPDRPFDWQEAPVEFFDPPITFGQNDQNGFLYRCSWDNKTDPPRKLEFGESANKEMCFFWAYYYPTTGYHICISPGSLFPIPEICCGEGADICDQYFQ